METTTIQTVFSSGMDTLEGVIGILTPGVDVSLEPGTLTPAQEGITMNANGSITVKAGTPPGRYVYTYRICQKDEHTNCSEAKVSLEVVATHIVANDDGIWEIGTLGGLTPSILNNDILNDKVGLTESDVVIEDTAGETPHDPKLVKGNDGRITVKRGLAPREEPYIYHYTIKERAAGRELASAVVRIKIVSFAAADDELSAIKQPIPQTTESVLANDELNGKKHPQPGVDVIFTSGVIKTPTGQVATRFTFNDDGTITVPGDAPEGVYTFSYKICKKDAPDTCKTAQGVLKVQTVKAENDDYSATPVNTVGGAKIIGNVLDNDRYQGGPAIAHKNKGIVSRGDRGNDGGRIQIDREGQVIVPQGMPAGTYTIEYKLCVENTNSCDTATVTIVVFEDKPLVIHNGISADGDGHNDSFIIEGIELYPDNNLKIFNRWGVLVYEKDGYRNDTEPFDGHSNGRATINASSKLPQGTYYYILDYKDTTGKLQQEKGWLYLKY